MVWALQELRPHQQAERQGVPRATLHRPLPQEEAGLHRDGPQG